MPLEQPYKELASSRRAIERMKSSKDFPEFEDNWKSYLYSIEKIWIKTERSCQKFKTAFQPWQGKYTRLRRQDSLLKYLKAARDADNHSIQESAKLQPPGRGIKFKDKSGGFIEKLVVKNGKILEYQGDPIEVGPVPARLKVERVKNNGNWYNVPSSHLDKPIKSDNPIIIAELGYSFYESFLEDTKKRFYN